MNVERINDYIDAYSNAIKIPNKYSVILKELIPKLIEKYSKQFTDIPVSADRYNKYLIKPKDGKYSIEDFFLNRLMRNVWQVNLESSSKGHYDYSDMSVNFNEEKIEGQLRKVIDTSRNDFEELNDIASKKVVMHEFEHALQTQFNNASLDMKYKANYKLIIDEIKKMKHGKYANEINDYETINQDPYGNVEYYIHSGLHYSSHNPNIETYREIDGFDNMNEIFNETESLEMAGARIQGQKTYGNSMYYSVRNAESSNMSITNYGFLIKELVGEQETFIGMYFEPERLFKKFNRRYDAIFKEEYGNDKSAWENLIEQILKIKENDQFEDHLKLDKVFARCLTLNAEHDAAPKIKNQIEQFKTLMISSTDDNIRKNFEHIKVLNSLEERISNHELNDKDGRKLDNPSYEEPTQENSEKTKSIESSQKENETQQQGHQNTVAPSHEETTQSTQKDRKALWNEQMKKWQDIYAEYRAEKDGDASGDKGGRKLDDLPYGEPAQENDKKAKSFEPSREEKEPQQQRHQNTAVPSQEKTTESPQKDRQALWNDQMKKWQEEDAKYRAEKLKGRAREIAVLDSERDVDYYMIAEQTGYIKGNYFGTKRREHDMGQSM